MSLSTGTLLTSACAVLLLGTDDSAEPRLLDLNVVALDSRSQPVTDLAIGDLQVTDAGKPQKIVFFRHRDSSVWQKPQLAPNELSNRGGAGIPNATVILFDLMNEGFGSRGTAANQIVHYLEGLETADYLYLYILTVEGRLFAVHGLPEGDENPGPESAPWTQKIKPMMDQSLKTVTRARPVDVDVANRVRLTFAGLDTLAVELSRVPGRKNLVWVTDGVPIGLGPRRSDTGEPVDFTPTLRRFSQALERSGVAIYPVRQVMLGSPDHIGESSGGVGATGGNDLGTQSIATLEEFANITGGRSGGGKDIGAAVTQAINDSRTSYQIGYYTPENNWDNKFHKVRVTCKRKGVRIQAKTGYYAWSDPPGVESEQAIKAAAGVPFDAAEIGLTGSLSGSQLKARIDAKDIAFAEAGDHYEAQLRIAVFGYAVDGRAENSTFVRAPLRYTAQERDKALNEGIAFTQKVAKADQFSKVRLIVFDRGSNAIGSLTIPVTR